MSRCTLKMTREPCWSTLMGARCIWVATAMPACGCRMGGHVEPGEHPLATAEREAAEELQIDADFGVVGPRPLFLTVTTTIGRTAGHVDVSLWYVVRGDGARNYDLDTTEFDGGRWWGIDPYGLPESDPHLGRFLRKLDAALHSADVVRLDG